MDDKILRGQVDLIREVFAYIHRFKDSLFVFRIHSQMLDHPLFPQLISDLALLHENGISIIIVPGARSQIDDILKTYGMESPTKGGIRISSKETIPFIKTAAFDVCNRVMTLLSAKGKNALIGNWVKARSLGVVDGVDYLYTGRVAKVQKEGIEKALKEGYIPIFPCIGWNDTGDAYNISSEELAVSLSASLKSRKLFFVENHNPIDRDDIQLPPELEQEEGRISKLSIESTQKVLDLNPGNHEISVLNHSLQAARAGVDRVHIVNGTLEGVILKEIFSNLGIGTMIFANIYEKIRPMTQEDISGVLSLMGPLAEQGILVGRSRRDLEKTYQDFVVYAVDDIIHGSAALHPYKDGQGEIAGLAVDPDYIKLSIGQRMVQYLLEQAVKEGLKQVFVLTTQTSDWFQKMGFIPGKVEDLPESKRESYNRDRNSRILIYPLS